MHRRELVKSRAHNRVKLFGERDVEKLTRITI